MKKVFRLLAFSLLLGSCKSYYLTADQLCTQLRSATPKQVAVRHSASFNTQRYTGNGVYKIVCYDKKGVEHELLNSPKIEMLIIDKKKHRHVYYFDTVMLEDSVLKGMNSRILATYRKINVADISKIKVQNGGKAFYYVN